MPSAYHQLELPEEVKERLSFTTPWGTYKNHRLPFGLKASASIFQALLDNIVAEVNLPGLVVYQDDIFIGSNSIDETIERLSKLLQVLQKYNITLNLAKCIFHVTEVNCLGFKISKSKISPISANIKKINSFPVPKSRRQVKRFLGLCGFYRNLIPSYATLTEPLVLLTSTKTPFKWGCAQNNAFDNLQRIFFQQPFLRRPDFNKVFYLNTDASKVAISAVLLQKFDNILLPISYYSKSLRNAEKNYPAIKLELMAIVKGIQAFKDILYGREFIVLSDAKPLAHYRKTTSPADIVTRWLLQLSEYSFQFEHVPGKQNLIADYLSRTHFVNNSSDINSDPTILNTDQILPMCTENAELNSLQSKTVNYVNHTQNCVNFVSSSCANAPCKPSRVDAPLEISEQTLIYEQFMDQDIQKIISERNLHNKHNDIYYICPRTKLLLYISKNRFHPDGTPVLRVVMPKSLRQKCIYLFHFPHFGIEKTYQKCADKYYWRGIYKDIVNYIKSCEVCVKGKNHVIPPAPFQSAPVPSRPGQVISLDFVGPFKNGQYILTTIDHFSKFIYLYVMKKITAMNTVKAIFDYFCTFGKPEVILTDNGTQFTAHLFEEFSKMMGIKVTHTCISHPQGNSVSERLNTSLKATIKTLMLDGYSFENAVKIHQSMYNSTFHSTTKHTPNLAHFGRELPNLTDAFSPVDPGNRLDVPNDYFVLLQNLNTLYEQIQQNISTFQKVQNKKQAPKAKLREFSIGDTVYLQCKGKLNTLYRGPFNIVKKLSKVTYMIQLAEDDESPPLRIHVNRLFASNPHRRDILSFPNNRPLGSKVHSLDQLDQMLIPPNKLLTNTRNVINNSNAKNSNHRSTESLPHHSQTNDDLNSSIIINPILANNPNLSNVNHNNTNVQHINTNHNNIMPILPSIPEESLNENIQLNDNSNDCESVAEVSYFPINVQNSPPPLEDYSEANSTDQNHICYDTPPPLEDYSDVVRASHNQSNSIQNSSFNSVNDDTLLPSANSSINLNIQNTSDNNQNIDNIVNDSTVNNDISNDINNEDVQTNNPNMPYNLRSHSRASSKS